MLLIGTVPPTISSTGMDLLLNSSDSVTMDCIVDGNPPPPAIFWVFNERTVITVSWLLTSRNACKDPIKM